MEPHWEGRIKLFKTSPGQMTKMAATLIYVKNLEKSFSLEILKLGMQHRELKVVYMKMANLTVMPND